MNVIRRNSDSVCLFTVDFRLLPFCLALTTDTFANSEDPDETDRNEPSHHELYCLPFCF